MAVERNNRPAAVPGQAPGVARAARAHGAAGTIITVAPTGAELDKSAVQALPVTLDELVTTANELVTTAKECREAGAAMVHEHIRDTNAQAMLGFSDRH